ncbi:MAG: hypothetical protein R2856_07730 [Caldilineaceae bacterium]
MMASEVGVTRYPGGPHRPQGRLQPGRMLLVDFVAKGRIIADRRDQSHGRSAGIPTANGWTSTWSTSGSAPAAARVEGPDHETVLQRQQAFSHTFETLRRNGRPDGATASILWKRWATIHRWPSPGQCNCSTTTSSSSSPG